MGVGFDLPKRWNVLYPTRVEMIRVCRALGFSEPRESTGPTNVLLGSLVHVISAYVVERDRLLKLDHSLLEAKQLARDYMQSYEYEGVPLGAPKFPKKTKWLFCGLKDGEDSVPKQFEKDYCGNVFHFECAGLLQVPKGDRAPCMHCLAQQRYRAKPAAGQSLVEKVMWLESGVPRVLELSPPPFPVILLDCKCLEAIGTGLPCEGMLAVARHLGGVLHFSHFHSHWMSHKVVGFVTPSPVFDGNGSVLLDLGAVINQDGGYPAASALDEGLPKPLGVQLDRATGVVEAPVMTTSSAPGGRPLVARMGVEDQAPVLFTAVIDPPAPAASLVSRRKKPKNGTTKSSGSGGKKRKKKKKSGK
jgi:hypothetical protein